MKPHYRSSAGINALAVVLLVVVGLGLFLVFAVVGVLIAIVKVAVEHIWEIVAFAGGVGLIAGVVVLVKYLAAWRLRVYLRLCRDLSVRGRLDAKERQELERLAAKLDATDPVRQLEEEKVYRDLVSRVLADGIVDEHERVVLRDLERLFEYDPAITASIKEEAFAGLTLAAMGDFSESTEQLARRNGENLGLSLAAVEARLRPLVAHREQVEAREQAEREAERRRWEEQERRRAKTAEDYTRAASVLDAQARAPIRSPAKLQKSEIAYHAIPATELKRRKKGDQRRPGQLVITDRRVVHAGEGSVSIRLSTVVDTAADTDGDLLRIIKDGRKTPYLFEVPWPQEVLAHILRSLEELE